MMKTQRSIQLGQHFHITERLKPGFYQRSASYARVLAIVVCLSVCHTPVLQCLNCRGLGGV